VEEFRDASFSNRVCLEQGAGGRKPRCSRVIPSSLQEPAQSPGLERMARATRGVVQLARRDRAGVLARAARPRLSEFPEEELRGPKLDKLVAAELLFRKGPPAEVQLHLSKHALIQDAAYGSPPPHDPGRSFHRAIAGRARSDLPGDRRGPAGNSGSPGTSPWPETPARAVSSNWRAARPGGRKVAQREPRGPSPQLPPRGLELLAGPAGHPTNATPWN